MIRHNSSIYNKGFTLIELIIVILITSILSGVLLTIMSGPMTQFVQVEQRANLVDIAETALLRMTREIRLALPNSIRVNAGPEIEFIRTVDGGRYRSKVDPTDANIQCSSKSDEKLSFSRDTDCFEIMGALQNLPGTILTGSNQTACLNQTALCLVIFNTGQSGANVYALDNIAAISAINSTRITFDNSGVAGFKFPHKSPQQRFFIIDTPVKFTCDGTKIDRVFNYNFFAGTGGTSNLLVNQLSNCTFTYNAGTATRAGLVTISITVRDNDLGQQVTLLQQAHVDNQP
ncbi:MAG TPA: prepilin-type N-terminal cleavage/methylation domain-containing protein [Thiotrichaceae bacterium]|nr:prepilin-type N-terminal cleavage/methylation domain-containing protein [Thiotrichaceae bacterium]